MKVFERYFDRNRPAFLPRFSGDLSLIIILPVLDEPEVFHTIASIASCKRAGVKVGVIGVVNHAENSDPAVKERNEATYLALKKYAAGRQNPDLEFCFVKAFDLPVKASGVGVARKMAMDAAAWYFYQQGNPEGVIASLDADTLVEENYLTELVDCFKRTGVSGVSVYYAHLLEYTEEPLKEAIAKYELYLRYYCRALRFIAHPYAFPCIGSAFAVRVSDYVAQGGMNKRQAGEDFYFLQKLIATGRFANLTTTTVWPSARISSRTPFGTGQSVRQIIADGGMLLTYNLNAFRELKTFFEGIPLLYKATPAAVKTYMDSQAPVLSEFLRTVDFPAIITEVNANIASLPLFRKRFFDNFNAFRVLKYLNFAHAACWRRLPVEEMTRALLSETGIGSPASLYDLLNLVRELDRRQE